MKYRIRNSASAKPMVKCIRNKDKNCLMRMKLEERTCSS